MSRRRLFLLGSPLFAIATIALLWSTGWWRHVLNIDCYGRDRSDFRLNLDKKLTESVLDRVSGIGPESPSETLLIACFPGRTKFTYLSRRVNSRESAGDKLRQILGPQIDKWEINVDGPNDEYSATYQQRVGYRGLTHAESSSDLSTYIQRFAPNPNRLVLVFAPENAPTQAEGMKRIASEKGRAIYQPKPESKIISLSVQADYTFTSLVQSFAAVFLPVWGLFVIPLLGGLVSLLIRDVYNKSDAYRWVVYPLMALSLLVGFGFGQSERMNALASMFVANDIQSRLFIACVFLSPVAAYFGEFFFIAPTWNNNNVSSSLRAQAYHRVRFAVLGLVVGFLLSSFFNGWGDSPMPLIMAYPLWFIFFGSYDTEEAKDSVLLDIVQKTATDFKIECKKVCLISSKEVSKWVNAYAVNTGVILLTRHAYFELNRDETQFLVAHECSHLAKMEDAKPIRPWVGLGGPCLGLLIFGLLFGYLSLSAIVVSFVLVLGLSIWSKATKTNPQQQVELSCDTDALRYTKNLDAAIGVMEKLRRPKEKRDNTSTHPYTDDRIENLRVVAKKLGLVETEPASVV